jgi:hypothetical protein
MDKEIAMSRGLWIASTASCIGVALLVLGGCRSVPDERLADVSKRILITMEDSLADDAAPYKHRVHLGTGGTYFGTPGGPIENLEWLLLDDRGKHDEAPVVALYVHPNTGMQVSALAEAIDRLRGVFLRTAPPGRRLIIRVYSADLFNARVRREAQDSEGLGRTQPSN